MTHIEFSKLLHYTGEARKMGQRKKPCVGWCFWEFAVSLKIIIKHTSKIMYETRIKVYHKISIMVSIVQGTEIYFRK